MNARRVVVALGCCLTLGLSGCTIGTKQQQADLIDRARTLAAKEKTALGVLTIKLTARSRPPTSVPASGVGAGTLGPFTMRVPVGFDFAGGRVGLTIAAQAPASADSATPAAEPVATPTAEEIPVTAIFQDGQIVVRRSNLRPTERRSWARLDFTGLPSNEPAPNPDDLPGALGLFWAANTINPAYMLDLTKGTLAGSVKQAGTATIASVATTHYKANLSRDQAISKLKLTDDDKATRQLMFRLLSVRNDIVPGEFWIDGKGLLRRMKVTLREQFRRSLSNDLTVTIDLPDYGVVVQLPKPGAEETLQLERYGALVRAVTPKIG
jgi:hypothetical protein